MLADSTAPLVRYLRYAVSAREVVLPPVPGPVDRAAGSVPALLVIPTMVTAGAVTAVSLPQSVLSARG
ncbi:hypothetical protein [Blastococcus saxobsidens]|uniref:Uncharacterized protein n=1 Tax=Blastococcus saxobsidens (strain DD2) TaxID=1146883 RepID=H6RRI4_BLASD|nr:hypothetical protein [Blastococcus saxobsidens]CCG05466.1 protein of unknown function [Blastococcus saxobsidens DD2]